MVAFYLRDGILKDAFNLKYAFVKLILSNDGRSLCSPAKVALPCSSHNVSTTHAACQLWNSVILDKRNSIRGIYIILYYLHKIRLSSYFNCTTLDLHLSQLHLYDYRLHGSRAIHFRGKGVKWSLRKPEEGEINSSPVQLSEMGKLLFYAEETNYMILGVTQQSSEKLVPTNLQDDIQETAVCVTPERNIPYFYVNQ